jgi:acyl-CoA synthetase (AMP-forming)/AMP-acid ligase II
MTDGGPKDTKLEHYNYEDLIRSSSTDYEFQDINEGKILQWWVPDKIFFTPQIPRTSVGKIDAMKLIEEYRDKV